MSVAEWKAKRAAEEKPKKESRTQRQLKLLNKLPTLDAGNLFDKNITYDEGVEKARKYYDKLKRKPIKAPAFNNREVIFDDIGWEHLTDKEHPLNTLGRLRRLKKAESALKNINIIDEERLLKNGNINFGLLAKFKDEDIITVVVKEIDSQLKFHNLYPDKKLKNKIKPGSSATNRKR